MSARWLLAVALGGLVLMAACSPAPGRSPKAATPAGLASPQPTSPPAANGTPGAGSPAPGAPLTWCTVAKVVDGDTIDVEDCADAGRIRLILVDAPEASGECFADEARAALARLTPPGSRVGLERDVSDVDRYGRYLRYAWTEAGLVNERLVRDGYARLAVFPPDLRYRDPIAAAEADARAAAAGRWGACRARPRVAD